MNPTQISDILAGGALAGFIALISLWWRVRKESKDVKAQVTDTAMNAAKEAVGVVDSAMKAQKTQIQELSTRVTDQGTQIADLGTRLTDVQKRHEIAITHIAERETWTVQTWSKRPDGLPPIPEVLAGEVVKIKPVLADSVIIKTDSRPIARNPPAT